MDSSVRTAPAVENRWTRRGALSAAAGLFASAAFAQPVTRLPEATACAPPPAAEVEEDPFTLPATDSSYARFSVPVTIDGKGPFPFVVDTGADHTTLSQELADALQLPRGRNIRVHSISGASIAPTARVQSLEVGSHSIGDVSLALLPRKGLAAPGLLGLDAVADQRVTLDFKKRQMTIRKSKGLAFDPDAIVVKAARRLSGQLLLVDTTIRSEPIFVILDTGAEISVGNSAMQALETRRRKRQALLEAVDVISVTGEAQAGVVDRIAEITLEHVKMHGAPVTWSDLHVFKRFGVADQPALLLGMDVMRAFERIELDFGRRQIGFVLPREGLTQMDSYQFR